MILWAPGKPCSKDRATAHPLNRRNKPVPPQFSKTMPPQLSIFPIKCRVDKAGVVQAPVGKVSFGAGKLKRDLERPLGALIRMESTAAQGTYVKSIQRSSHMR